MAEDDNEKEHEGNRYQYYQENNAGNEDGYVPYSLKEILIPLTAKNEPVYSTLGTLSFYLFLAVIGSSDFLVKKLGLKRWKKLHIAVIPAWILMVIHGMSIGTDSSKPWALFIYASGVSILVVLGFIRYMESATDHLKPARTLTPDKKNKQSETDGLSIRR